jgi:hypothetical protein
MELEFEPGSDFKATLDNFSVLSLKNKKQNKTKKYLAKALDYHL